ncbi:MAG: hypothetical protein GX137_07130 [Thermoplasmatales archaeon]|nr:hypothetical protein [Thermoplasmatales archaeon]
MNRLYKMYELEADKVNLPLKLDYFLIAANSDQRCYNSLSLLLDYNCNIENIVLFDYQKLRPKPKDINGVITPNLEILEENYNNYKNFNPTVNHPCVKDDDDVNFMATMTLSENTQIGIDITGFTVPDVFRILYILKELKKIRSLYVYYTEPQHYIFKENIFNKYEHLLGESIYKPVPEYFTVGSYERELLVFFLGFDLLRSNYIYEKALPDEVVVINGFPAYIPKLKDISLLNNYSFLTAHVDNGHIFYTRANNPFSAYNTLCDIRGQFPDYLLNVCVLGTKPMALGACLFCLENKENVKVTYPYPQQYAPNTTQARTKSWCYIINFD